VGLARLRCGCALIAASATCAIAPQALAQDEDGIPDIHIHGFASQGFLVTTSNDYLAEDSTDGSFEFTEVGLNFTSQLTDELRVGVQLFARDLGPLGNYRPQFDWYYLDYRLRDWLGLRAGRTKIPFGLYNETSDIDAARVPVLLPQSMYPTQNRDALLAQTGGELYGNIELGPVGELEYRAYGGTIFIDTSESPDELTSVSVPYLYGGRVMWQPPVPGLQLGGSAQRLRLEVDYAPPPEVVAALAEAGQLPADFTGTVSADLPLTLWAASLEWAAYDFLFATEYSRWSGTIETNVPALVPEAETNQERFYAMASYRVAPWFTPGAYYSLLFPQADQRSGREAVQHDIALTARYDLNEHWLFKVEGHYMIGTAALSSAQNDNVPLANLSPEWGLLLLKTTAYF
jgi:hypothetical protein